MRGAGIGAVLLSDPDDVCYATGFEVPQPIDARESFSYGPPLSLVTAEGATALVVSAAYGEATNTSCADRTFLVPGVGQFESIDIRAELISSLRSALDELEVSDGTKLGLDATTLPAELRSCVVALLPASEVADSASVARSARMIKTESEIALLREAAAAADAAQAALLEFARPGRTELEVMGDVVTAANRAGGRPLPWVGELVTGPRTGVPAYPAGPIERELVAGDTALMDFSVRRSGYWSDCTNTLVVAAEPTAEQVRYFRAARDAYDAAVAELRPGRWASDVHTAACEALRKHGFDAVHYTGHQIGASVNETPRLVPYDHTPIEVGMVFAVEPGCYGGPELGVGARAERVVHVADRGAVQLTNFPWGITG